MLDVVHEEETDNEADYKRVVLIPHILKYLLLGRNVTKYFLNEKPVWENKLLLLKL